MTLTIHASTTLMWMLPLDFLTKRTWIQSDSEDEVEFDFVNPIVGEMFAYMQWHYDKQPMHTSVLTENGYMEEVEEGNPKKCFELFHMTRPLLLHLVDELHDHDYLRDG